MKKGYSFRTKFAINCMVMLLVLYMVGCSSMAMKLPDEGSPEAASFRRTCILCHRLPHPGEMTAEHWRHLFERMMEHAGEKKFPPLPEEMRRQILDYLVTNAK